MDQLRIAKKGQCNNYCIFIASRYFESIEDHLNLIRVSKRMRCNMEKFHYNPISVDMTSLPLFPNIQTLHIYKEGETYLEGGRIERYVNWNPISYHKMEEIKMAQPFHIHNYDTELYYTYRTWNDTTFLFVQKMIKSLHLKLYYTKNYK